MIFLDTSAFLAIENPQDAHHQSALDFRKKCFQQRHVFMTTDYVLDETYTLLRRRANHRVAVHFGEDIRKSKLIQIQYLAPEILDRAWNIFKTYSRLFLSFTDCTSFAVMEKYKIQTAFSFDSDFQKYGQFLVNP